MPAVDYGLCSTCNTRTSRHQSLSRDNFWRIVYDRLPKPPGQDVPGADRITIFDDKDGDGSIHELGDL